MMPSYRMCLLLAIGAVLAVSASGASAGGVDADVRNDTFKVWDAFKPLSRAKRGAFLGIVGTVIGNIFLAKSKVLTWAFEVLDTPMRWINNMIATWANYFDNHTPGNPINPRWNIFG